jgi:hypothetical protein
MHSNPAMAAQSGCPFHADERPVTADAEYIDLSFQAKHPRSRDHAHEFHLLAGVKGPMYFWATTRWPHQTLLTPFSGWDI